MAAGQSGMYANTEGLLCPSTLLTFQKRRLVADYEIRLQGLIV